MTEIIRATVDLYRAGEHGLLRLVTRYLATGIDTPGWAIERLAALGQLRRAGQDILDSISDELAETVLQAVANAYAAGGASVLEEIPTELSAGAAAGAAATAVVPRSAAMEALAQALVQDIGARHSNVLRHITDVYRRVVAEGTAASIAGGLTRREASQLTYARLVEQGVVSFVDARGRRWRMSSYVEMAIRTVTQRAAVQGQVDKQRRLGLPFVVVSNEAQECERCRPYEGRVLRIGSGPTGTIEVAHQTTGEPVTIDVRATLDDARSWGFQHPNCRHSVRSYLPGITRLPRQPTADPDGDAARQRQRAIERAIRRWKERELAALTPAAAAQARARVVLWQGQMRQHLAANPTLKRLSYREQIGAGSAPR
ncbi:phage minor capsid protein [Streptomyces purpurogeneiscleroticus]|nr:phage minor capsid protein [Streptomyces purpurogeneiscleroticus]